MKKLNLDFIPDILDDNIIALCNELTLPQTSLEKLTVISPRLGESSGRAIASMLLVNTSIQALKLYIRWGSCGTCMAEVLRSNTTLQSMDLQLDEKDRSSVSSQAISIAEALCQEPYQHIAEGRSYQKTGVRKLRLCFDDDREDATTSILNAFDKTLDVNETLEELLIVVGIWRLPLPPAIDFKLKLNRGNVRKLFRCQQVGEKAVATTDEQFCEALIAQKDDMDVTFFILQNHPSLCLGWRDSLTDAPKPVATETRAFGTQHRLGRLGFPSRKRKASPRHIKNLDAGLSSLTALTSIRRRVKSILAPSA
jgi:hypothetical protein